MKTPLQKAESLAKDLANRSPRGNFTPFLMMDKDKIGENYAALKKAFPIEIFYSVKTNPDSMVLKQLADMGSSFEVVSLDEVRRVLDSGTNPECIIFSNPVKKTFEIEQAYKHGVKMYVFDSICEIDKLSNHAPGCMALVRIDVEHSESKFPSARKYGVNIEQALKMLEYAKRKKIEPCGVAFHIGSQCTNSTDYIHALGRVKVLVEDSARIGIPLKVVDIGGGFPVRYEEAVPDIGVYGKVIMDYINQNLSEYRIVAEPGRYLVSTAGVIVSSVLGLASRASGEWAYLDVGIYNSLIDIRLVKQRFRISCLKKIAKSKKYILSGPVSDSLDVIAENVELPQLEVGDLVYIEDAGAYTVALATAFSGISIPKVYVV